MVLMFGAEGVRESIRVGEWGTEHVSVVATRHPEVETALSGEGGAETHNSTHGQKGKSKRSL